MNIKNKILIVTSNDDHRYLLKVLLTDAGYEVDAPEDLKLCTKCIENNKYFKVVLDYDYRVQENRIFCNYLEMNRCFGKSVVIQAISNEDITCKVYEQGGSVLNKPYDTNSLLFIVNS